MKVKYIFLFAVIGVFLVGCPATQDDPIPNKPKKVFDVEFTVNPGGSKLKIVE